MAFNPYSNPHARAASGGPRFTRPGRGRQQPRGGDDRRPVRTQRNPRRPGQQGWNPSGSYAKPTTPAKPPAPWKPPPNPAYTQATSVFHRDRGQTQARYGTGATDDPFAQRYGQSGVDLQKEYGFTPEGQIDVTNPNGRAYLLQESFKRSQRGTSIGMGARGQLYSGALQTMLQQGQRRHDSAQAQLSHQFQRGLQGIDAARTESLDEIGDAYRGAGEEHRRFVESQRPDVPAMGTPAEYHPVVQQTMDQAQRLWDAGKRRGRVWGDIISILGYDPRPGKDAPDDAWRLGRG